MKLMTIILRKGRGRRSSCSLWCRIESIEFSSRFFEVLVQIHQIQRLYCQSPRPSTANPVPHLLVRQRLWLGFNKFGSRFCNSCNHFAPPSYSIVKGLQTTITVNRGSWRLKWYTKGKETKNVILAHYTKEVQ